MSKFVCLEDLKENSRFYTTYHEGEDATRLADGTVAYKVLGYADTDREARVILDGPNCDEPEVKAFKIYDYLLKTSPEGLFSREDMARLAVLCATDHEESEK
jgi:hypothetical protein